MNISKILLKINKTLDEWESELDQFSSEEFSKQPDKDSWSIGQVYEHLIQGTLQFHCKEIETCLTENKNTSGKKTIPGNLIFLIKSFPPIKIKVPASDMYTPKQPLDKKEIPERFQNIKNVLKILAVKIEQSKSLGKTKHPGFGYLNAKEWFLLIEMHFRHHKRQKQKIIKFLKS